MTTFALGGVAGYGLGRNQSPADRLATIQLDVIDSTKAEAKRRSDDVDRWTQDVAGVDPNEPPLAKNDDVQLVVDGHVVAVDEHQNEFLLPAREGGKVGIAKGVKGRVFSVVTPGDGSKRAVRVGIVSDGHEIAISSPALWRRVK